MLHETQAELGFVTWLTHRFVNGTGVGVWAEQPTAPPSSPNASLAIWVAEVQKMFPSYKYGVNLFMMAYGEHAKCKLHNIQSKELPARAASKVLAMCALATHFP
jgi:hypothetical protein